MKKQSLAYSLATIALRVALLVALVGFGWSIYRRLPDGGVRTKEAASETVLQIVLRPSARDNSAALNISVQLYPVDIAAVEREFRFEYHPGLRYEDFLKDRMQGRAVVKANLDDRGRATVLVLPGKWWVHALLSGAQNVEWRLPVNVSGRQQTVELNAENSYARTKSF